MIKVNILKNELRNYFDLPGILSPKEMNMIEIFLEIYVAWKEHVFSLPYKIEDFITDNFSNIYFILYRIFKYSKDTHDVMVKTIVYIKFFNLYLHENKIDCVKEYFFLPFYFNDKSEILDLVRRKDIRKDIKNFRNETIEEYCKNNNIKII